MEGFDSTGKYSLVRSTSSWASSLFSRTAPHPNGNSLTQKAMASDDNFTILDCIPLGQSLRAIELTPIDPRSVHSTMGRFSTYIQPGVLQHLGDNVAAFANQVLLLDPASIPPTASATPTNSYGTATSIVIPGQYYASFFGWFMVTTSFSTIGIATAASAGCSVVIIALVGSIFKRRIKIGTRTIQRVLKDLLIGLAWLVTKSVAALAVVSIVTLISASTLPWNSPFRFAYYLVFQGLSAVVPWAAMNAVLFHYEMKRSHHDGQDTRPDLLVSLLKPVPPSYEDIELADREHPEQLPMYEVPVAPPGNLAATNTHASNSGPDSASSESHSNADLVYFAGPPANSALSTAGTSESVDADAAVGSSARATNTVPAASIGHPAFSNDPPARPRFVYGYANFIDLAVLAIFHTLMCIVSVFIFPDIALFGVWFRSLEDATPNTIGRVTSMVIDSCASIVFRLRLRCWSHWVKCLSIRH
ncbi:uncharacterized protein BJ171DRAFT_473258 [Polychytrium aggregatum]|uniref:uncharacterized protein n=1 Tax=Polychytrium aggregatum TaxID=110093 RepID=UPI0022FE5CAB|nr:uncharacterized protein BJ171DRAFT_473258 [Polychytrium aggregatum]KAI9206761.1 hypothetical protein BJ171DRAFT_473258 [Polychytrium aggregatum]